MLINEFTTNSSEVNKAHKTNANNAEAIDRTYYEYHGKQDDGNSPADEYKAVMSV